MNKLFTIASSRNIHKELGTIKERYQITCFRLENTSISIDKRVIVNGPKSVYVQVLGSGARGVPNTMLIQTDSKRYLFNCGEGVKRLAHQFKLKRKTFTNIFITSNSWNNIGGLSNLLLTLRYDGVKHQVNLHSPDDLDKLYKDLTFVYLNDLKIQMKKCTTGQVFQDSNITVKCVHLQSQNNNTELTVEDTVLEKRNIVNDSFNVYRMSHKVKNRNGNAANLESHNNTTGIVKDKLGKLETKQNLDIMKRKSGHVAYICNVKKRRADLDSAQCSERGVKAGDKLDKLKRGLDVRMPDGSLFLASDVLIPEYPEIVLIVLEVPNVSYLSESQFKAHFDDGTNPPEVVPALVVHYTPPDVFHHPKYQAFMANFGPTAKHIVLNSDNACLASSYVHSVQHKLHLLDAKIFPLLGDDCEMVKCENVDDVRENEGVRRLEVIEGRALTKYHLRPERVLDNSSNDDLPDRDQCIQELMAIEGFPSHLEQIHKLVAEKRRANGDTSEEYPKVIILGTSSGEATKLRNTSGIIIQTKHDSSILLDCGEGTFTQMVRFFGLGRIDAFLRTLKVIYVSHMHIDHHIGLIGILQGRRQAFRGLSPTVPRVLLLAPRYIMDWLTTYHRQFENILNDFIHVPNNSLFQWRSIPDVVSSILPSMDLESLVTCYVNHAENAFGLAMQLPRHKITYSADTMPCEDLISIGLNSTLLIHEATLPDDMVKEAVLRNHSTTSQAIEVGRQMRARYTVLTHFSTRCALVPGLEKILKRNPNVGIAFDNMQLSMGDLELLSHMYGVLQLIFADEVKLAKTRALKRVKHT